MRRKLFTCFYFIIAITLKGVTQTVAVKGKVTDVKGLPLAGVSVIQKNTARGTVTLNDGTFNLSAPKGSRLVVSAVGFEMNEIAAAPSLNIKMNPAAGTLTDVVVTGVGVGTSRKRVPIDVASISSRDFAKSTTSSIEQALTGQIAGCSDSAKQWSAL